MDMNIAPISSTSARVGDEQEPEASSNASGTLPDKANP